MKENIYEKLSYCNSIFCDNYNNSYALLVSVFFEMDNAFGEEKNFVDDNNDKITYSQQVVETKCKSPCPSSAEMCIAMCA